jgi:hypothetical protein
MFRREGLSPKILYGLQPPRLEHPMRQLQKPEQGSVTALKRNSAARRAEDSKLENEFIQSTCLRLSGFGLLGQLMANDIGRSYLEPSLWPVLCRVPLHHNHRR